MKKCLSFLLLITILPSCIGFSSSSDEETVITTGNKTSYKEWLELARLDIRLFPKYGYAVKTSKQLEVDQEFLKVAIAESGTPDSASRYYFLKACDYMEQEDLQTAMYRLNQAWLLNAKNPDVYRGFGWVYLQLEQYEMAIKLFDEGLRMDPDNVDLKTMKTHTNLMVKEHS